MKRGDTSSVVPAIVIKADSSWGRMTPADVPTRISTNANSPTCASPSAGRQQSRKRCPVHQNATTAAAALTEVRTSTPSRATIGFRKISDTSINSPRLTKKTAAKASRNGRISESTCSDQRFPPKASPAAKAPSAGGRPIRYATSVTPPSTVSVNNTTRSGLRCRVTRGINQTLSP